MRRPSADWAVWFTSSCSTTYPRRAGPRHLRSHAQPALSRRARSLRRRGHAVRVQHPNRKRESRGRSRTCPEDTAQRVASKVWRKPKPTWITGKSAGPTPAFTAPPNAKWRPCSPKKNRRCCRCRSNPSAITNTASARSIWTAAWKSMQPITARRRDGSVGWSTCR